MANVKGIVVEIGGDTSGLQEALKKVEKQTSSLSKELKGINSLLKLDPKNTELLSQKQKILADEISVVSTKLEELKEHQKQVADSGIELNEKQQEKYRALQREIISTEEKLKNLKLEASNWTQVSRKLEEIGTVFTNIGSKIEEAGKKLSVLSASTGALITLGLKYNADIEKAEKSMEAFLGSSEEAEKVIEEIKKQSQSSPFNLTDLIKANQMLITADVNAGQSVETINALADAIALTGGGNEELTRMASNLQQIQNAGKATSMDIRQFAYAGIDIYGILAETTGKTTEELKKMDISFEDVSNALIQASKEGGKYYKGQSKSAETLSGKVNTLKKEFQELLGEITENLLPVAKKIISRVSEIIKKFKALDDSTKERIAKIGLIVTALSPVVIITGKLITSLGTIITTLSKLTGIIAKVSTGTATLTTALGLGAVGVSALTGLTIALSEKHKILTDDLKKLKERTDEQRTSWDNLKDSAQKYLDTNSTEVTNLQRLKDELANIVDENGKVKTGYEERARFITNQLSEALGIEIGLNNGIIENYQEIESAIDGVIRKKKVELLLNAHAEEYITALEKEKEATELLFDIEDKIAKKNEEIAEAKKKAHNTQEVMKLQGELTILNGQLAEQRDLVGEYSYTIQNYEELQNKSISGTAEEIDLAIERITTSWDKSTKQVGMNITEQERMFDGLVTYVGDTQEGIAEEINNSDVVVKAMQGQTNRVRSAWVENVNGEEWGADLADDISAGIDSKASKLLSSVTNVASRIKDVLGFSIPKEGPLSNFDKSMPDMIDLMVKGLRNSYPKLEFEVSKIAQNMSSILQVDMNSADITQKVIATSPNVVAVNFYPQQMTEAEMDRAFNYVDRRYGQAY